MNFARVEFLTPTQSGSWSRKEKVRRKRSDMDNWAVQLVLCIVQTVLYGIQLYSFISDFPATCCNFEQPTSASPLNYA